MTATREQVHDSDHGVYGISVAAELAGMAASSLRLYETHGLLDPDRTPGGTRRYSVNDLDRLRVIAQLLDDGVNLPGIARVLALQAENERLRDRCARLHTRPA
ncbi:MerR family transcriptional regulator [Ornithinimicrobium sp. LYQ103]|uniref:MerR family transcriptional regulator n=1 Tax=Ornithinimicrobium sp. LYQ103 TaxID=3378796 RepID=UPI003852F149